MHRRKMRGGAEEGKTETKKQQPTTKYFHLCLEVLSEKHNSTKLNETVSDFTCLTLR